MAHTHTQTDGHGDSLTDPAQRAESVKKKKKITVHDDLEGGKCY